MDAKLKEALNRARSFGWNQWQSKGRSDGFIIAEIAQRALNQNGSVIILSELLAWSATLRSPARRIIAHYARTKKEG